jgi:hydrogenase nickel incorporation protein HypA/HybF
MHELSIALGIVDIASDAVSRAGASGVSHIELEIGELAGVEMPALDFAWSEAVRGTVLAAATRQVHRVAGQARCMECDHVFAAGRAMNKCPACASPFTELVHGKELRVHAITVF